MAQSARHLVNFERRSPLLITKSFHNCAWLIPSQPILPALVILALQVDGVGKERVGVGVVEGVLGGQLHGVVVAVAEVVSALNLAQVGSLVKVGRGLVLLVAGRRKVGQVAEVQVAVSLEALAGDRVGQDLRLAAVLNVGAVVLRDTAIGGAALAGDLGEDVRNGVAHLAVGGLEVLLDLGGVAGLGGLGGCGRELRAVLQRRLRHGESVAGAVALELRALDVLSERAQHGGSLGSVDSRLELVGVEGDGSNELVVSLVGEFEGAMGQEVVLAARGEVMDVADIEGDGNGLAGSNVLERLILDVAGADALTDAVEGDVLAYGARC